MELPKSLEFDKQGRITSPSLHDAYLVGLQIRPAGLEIFIETKSGDARILLAGLERLLVTEFREGNIIFDSGEARNDAHIEELFDILLQSSAEQQRPYRDEMKALIAAGERVLFYVSASYGAVVVALCRAVQLLR
jgi:hypothetical protein